MAIHKISTFKPRPALLIIISAVPIFGLCIWMISDTVKAGILDRQILYCVDELFRYNYIEMSLYNPYILLNPYLKVGYGTLHALFLHLLPLGISSLRTLNAIFSIGTLLLIYKITQKTRLPERASAFAILLAFTFPVYFLVSISTLAEIIFCFFLILAIYLIYCQRYFLSTLVIAFLPTVRQEGIIFLAIWLFLLPKGLKVKHGLLLIAPFLTWSILNKVLLGHRFLYTFFCNLPDKAPPYCLAPASQFFHTLGLLCLHPIFLTCLIGLALNRRNPKYRYLFICFVSYVTIILIANILHLIDAKAFSREIRFLVPLVPFMAIYGASAIEHFLRNKKTKKSFFLFSITTLLVIGAYQTQELQKDPEILKDSVSAAEELSIKRLGSWLKDFIEKEDVVDIYIPGEKSIDKIYRRLWGIYLVI